MMDKIKAYFRQAVMILSLLALCAIFQGLFTKLVFSAYSFLHPGVSVGQPFADAGAGVQSGTSYMLMSIGLLLSAVAMLLVLHFTGAFRFRKGIFTSIAARPLFLSVLLVFTSIWALNIFVQWFPLEDQLESQFDGLSHNILGVLSIAVFAPLLEEVLFRGAIQGYLMRRMRSPWLAIIISSLVFGIFHMNPIQIVYATLLGFVFGWIYYRTGNLLSVILGHVLNNSIAAFTMLFMKDVEETAVQNVGFEVGTFVLFLAVSFFLAFKLHRSLPAPPKPWCDSDEVQGDTLH